MELSLHRLLCDLALRLGDAGAEARHKAALEALRAEYAEAVDGRALVFRFFAFENITGIKLDYARELADLLGEDDAMEIED